MTKLVDRAAETTYTREMRCRLLPARTWPRSYGRKLGHDEAIDDAPFPTADSDALVQTHVVLPVTVNGKPRGEITVDRQASQAEVTDAGLALEAVAKLVEGKEIVRVVVVPGKIVNFVIR